MSTAPARSTSLQLFLYHKPPIKYISIISSSLQFPDISISYQSLTTPVVTSRKELQPVLFYVQSAFIIGQLLQNNPSSQHHISLIESSSLPRCNGSKRFMKLYMQGVIRQKSHRTTIGLLAVADFHNDILLPDQ